MSRRAQSQDRGGEVGFLHEEPVGVEGGKREDADAGFGERDGGGGEDAGFAEGERAGELEERPARFDQPAGRLFAFAAHHGGFGRSARDGEERGRERHDGIGGQPADREAAGLKAKGEGAHGEAAVYDGRAKERNKSMLTRRGVLGAMAVANAAAVPPERKPPSGKAGIRLALMQNPGMTDKMKLSKQIGVDYSIVNVQGVLSKTRKEEYVAALRKVKEDFAGYGLQIAAVESHPVPAEKIKLGAPGRDEEIENYQWAIDALAKVGINVICYNWMAGLGWYRTKVDVKERGNALTSEFDNEAALAQGPTQWGQILEEQVWDSLAYFQKRVLPVAEKAGVKMALHPDDPPLSPLRGIGRIVTSARNYRRIMDMAPSRINGVTYCQANFVAMGENIEALAKEWLAQKKIFFVHFRDIEGTRAKFRETFHDNGPTDMARMLQVYHEGGFDGAIRPDHAPTIGADTNDRPGYAYQGKILAIGYMKGALDGMRIPYL